MATAFIALGANIGNREENLCIALRGLTRMARVETVSSLYESDAVGPVQPSFYNAVCIVDTGLEPQSLLRFLKSLEHELGRRPGGPHRGPRPIDLDILLYDERVLESDELVVPHPRMTERAFVLVPLSEIAPNVRDPITGKTAAELAVSANERSVRRIKDAGWDGVAGNQGRVRI